MSRRNNAPARGWSGDGTVLKRGQAKISVVFDAATFSELSAIADSRRVSFASVIREMVRVGLIDHRENQQRAA